MLKSSNCWILSLYLKITGQDVFCVLKDFELLLFTTQLSSIMIITTNPNLLCLLLPNNDGNAFLCTKVTLVSGVCAGSALQVFGLVRSSTQSLLLRERECLTAAREAQGSIIDLTSQSCRALSPSFTPPACQPHANALMCTQTLRHTTTDTKHDAQTHKDV